MNIFEIAVILAIAAGSGAGVGFGYIAVSYLRSRGQRLAAASPTPGVLTTAGRGELREWGSDTIRRFHTMLSKHYGDTSRPQAWDAIRKSLGTMNDEWDRIVAANLDSEVNQIVTDYLAKTIQGLARPGSARAGDHSRVDEELTIISDRLRKISELSYREDLRELELNSEVLRVRYGAATPAREVELSVVENKRLSA